MNTQKRIKELMAARGWTDYRLAKEANLSHSTVTNMFNRNNAPTLPTLEAVCHAFGIILTQFFTENEESQMTEEHKAQKIREPEPLSQQSRLPEVPCFLHFFKRLFLNP